MSLFFHEQLYRSAETLKTFQTFPITICGAGALGANITENLARCGFGTLKVIDCDRIVEHNLSTQPYYRSDIGAYKAKILANSLYRAIATKIIPETKRLTDSNIQLLLKGSKLVIDAFDNSVSRQAVKDYCQTANLPCLHVGLASDYAEVMWNAIYRVPTPVNDDVCDYPLARNLVLLTVAVATEAIITWITTQNAQNYTLTLKDLSIQRVHL
jgi:molybdopterin/thiamine biosynthesis adenylyltransferase